MEAGAPELTVTNTHDRLRVDEEALRRLALRVVEEEGCRLRFLGIVLAGHASVHELNRTHLGHDYETDVLSFPLSEEEEVVDGEIYVDLDTAAQRHEEFGAGFEDEVRRYLVHGLLHLAGYEDESAEQKAVMRAREDHFLLY